MFKNSGIHLVLLAPVILFLGSCSREYFPIEHEKIDVRTEVDLEILENVIGEAEPFHIRETRSIRTYFHIINNLDSSMNFSEARAGDVVSELLNVANQRMKSNASMHLPKGNNTPSLNAHIKYVIARADDGPGIFFHYMNRPLTYRKKGKNKNLYERKSFSSLSQSPDSVVNVFLLPFDPDQLQSGEQLIEQTAIALGAIIKIPGMYESGQPAWSYAGIFNHEMGHILGLRHTWNVNDGCDDTPRHDNCWNKTDHPPCNDVTSNNLMDYNAHQSAITPCQIGRMHQRIAKPGTTAHSVARKDWCRGSNEETIIEEEEIIQDVVRISGDLVIVKNAKLTISAPIFMGPKKNIVVQRGGTLILRNALITSSCDVPWGNIVAQKGATIYKVGERNQLMQ